MRADQVSIVIPAFNEAAAIGPVIEQLRARFPESELIVIDDGSKDATAQIAEKAGARVIRHPRNRGYGAALRTGTTQATRDYVLFCDSDGQHSADDVGRIMEAGDDCDMVVGARTQVSHVPMSRRPGKFILAKFADYLAGEKIPDLNSGLRMIRREVLIKYLHLMPHGFSFSTTSTFAFLKTNRPRLIAGRFSAGATFYDPKSVLHHPIFRSITEGSDRYLPALGFNRDPGPVLIPLTMGEGTKSDQTSHG